MYRWILGVAVAGALAAALGTGCGGGSDSETSTVTKAQFIKQAEAVCQKTQDEVESGTADFFKQIRAKGGNVGSPANLETRINDVYVPALEGELEKLEAIGAPEADEQEIEAILANLAKGRQLMEEEGVAGMTRSAASLTKFQVGASKYGIEC